MQGGRYKAMFKLDKSLPEAKRLAKKDPDCFQVGNTAWVTARFTSEKPMPKKLWEKWLDESYQLSAGSNIASRSAKKKVSKKATKKKTASKKVKKKVTRKMAVKKGTPKKSATKK